MQQGAIADATAGIERVLSTPFGAPPRKVRACAYTTGGLKVAMAASSEMF